MSEAKEGKHAKEYSDFETSKLPQGFYDKVVANKDNPPIPPKKPEDEVEEDEEESEGDEEEEEGEGDEEEADDKTADGADK